MIGTVSAIAETPAAQRVDVLSIQTPLLGNKTYAELLRRAYRNSPAISFHALWGDERREPFSRLIGRILTRRAPITWINARNLDFFPARYELATSFMARRLLVRTLRNHLPDVLHFHTQCLALLSTDLIRRIPTVITADRTAALAAAHQTTPSWYWTFEVSRRLESAPLRNAAAVVTFSQWAADSMVRDDGVAPRRLFVIPPGVDLQRFDGIASVRTADRRGVKRILFVGGEFRRKGGPMLVDVFLDRLAAADVELHIVTTESDIPSHRQIIVHRDVQAYSARWRRLYAEADLFVMPSARDAFGHVYLEAMAARLPVVALGVGATPEIVADGETGYLVRPGDERALAERIRRLLDDESLRRRLGENGRRRVERFFTVEHHAAKLERLFVEIARGCALPS